MELVKLTVDLGSTGKAHWGRRGAGRVHGAGREGARRNHVDRAEVAMAEFTGTDEALAGCTGEVALAGHTETAVTQ